VVQIASLGLFLALFLLTIGRSNSGGKLVPMVGGPVDLFFRIDPLLGLTTMVAARKIITSLLWFGLPFVLISILAGRFFCGWLCPMGATLDAADTVFYRSRKRNAGRSQAYRNLKYYVLFAVLVASIFSAQAAYLLDPMAILTRALTFAIYAPTQMIAKTVGNTSFGYDHAPWLANNALFYGDHQTVYRMGFVFFLIFAGIVAANSISRRFWCRNLCPLGALLGLISRFSAVKRLVGSSCRECSRCQRECKMAAICDDPRNYVASECIYCYSCTKSCPTDGVRIVPSGLSRQHGTEINLTRRRTLQALGIGAAWAVLVKTDWAGKRIRETGIKASGPERLRPPGALPEEEFMARCVRCSECMKICPTNGLQPALAEAGIEGLWTPVLVPKIGECTEKCNLCSKVCASGAIEPFEIDEKPHIYIGTAVIDRSACLVWKDSKACLVCDEYCSYHALHWKEIDGVRKPFVDEKKCVGCGICESACPIQPQAAIRVFSFGDKRHMSREEQREWGKS
jgi:polyferredoxin/formate hydrogenlyase subunit 6/NADH:ubiquinone oxidoreductase subunit I